MRIAIRVMIALALLSTLTLTGVPLLNATLAAVAPIMVLEPPAPDGEPLVLNAIPPAGRPDLPVPELDPFLSQPPLDETTENPFIEAPSVTEELEALRRLKEPETAEIRQVAPEGMLAWPEPAGPLVRIPGRQPPQAEKSNQPDWRPIARPLIALPGRLTSGDLTIKLAGIEAPELDHICSEDRPCGRQARTALRMLVRGRTVECALDPDISEGEHEARCRLARIDLAEWMAEQGWALEAEQAYAEQLASAQEKGIGLYR